MTAFLGKVQEMKSRGSQGWVGLTLSEYGSPLGVGYRAVTPPSAAPLRTTLQRLDGRWSGGPSWGGGGGAGGMAAERQAAFLGVHLVTGVCARPAPPLTQVLL